MARFHFEPNNWSPTFEDHHGLDRGDLNAARQEATGAARTFMRLQAERGGLCPCCCIEVVAAAGSTIGTASSVTTVRATTA